MNPINEALKQAIKNIDRSVKTSNPAYKKFKKEMQESFNDPNYLEDKNNDN